VVIAIFIKQGKTKGPRCGILLFCGRKGFYAFFFFFAAFFFFAIVV